MVSDRSVCAVYLRSRHLVISRLIPSGGLLTTACSTGGYLSRQEPDHVWCHLADYEVVQGLPRRAVRRNQVATITKDVVVHACVLLIVVAERHYVCPHVTRRAAANEGSDGTNLTLLNGNVQSAATTFCEAVTPKR